MWKEYNTNLKKRGEITFWFSEDMEKTWIEKPKGKVGRPEYYSDGSIKACLQIRALFKLPLRATEGFVNSLFKMANLPLRSPSYTQLSRRMRHLKAYRIDVPCGSNLVVAVDSTGLKIFGEGEWKVKQHGTSKRRVWRKCHFAIDTKTHIIIAHKLTENSVSDGHAFNEMAPLMSDRVQAVLTDGAYDQTKCYENIRRMGARPIIPPRVNARCQRKIINPAKIPRDLAIAKIRHYGGDDAARKKWKKETGYHQRSLAETAMFRLKSTFGGSLQSRSLVNQESEIEIKVEMLNKIASLGMPKNI